MHWFLFVNVDEKGQDPVERFINNLFNRIYDQQEKMIMDNIRKKMTPEQRKEAEELDKRMEQYSKDVEQIRKDLKNGKY
jgi:type IV secretory pathway VirB4 component